jgi:phosphate transport system substrate-binding protein
MLKKLSWLLIAALLIVNFGYIFTVANPVEAAGIKVVVNDVTMKMSVAPVNEKGRVLVPVREIFEALGAKLNWDGETKTVTATRKDVTVKLVIGQKTAYVNGKAVTLDVAAKITKGKTMIPLRFVSEAFKSQVKWDSKSQTVTVDQFAGHTGTLKITGSTSVQPLAQELVDAFKKKNPDVQITVAGGGSSVGIKDVTDGKVNIGQSSRYLKPEEAKNLKAYVIANDGVAVVVNPQNSIKDITTEQVKKIFKGEITNWKDLGGADAPIILNVRDAASGTGEYFIEHFLGKGGKVAATAKTHASNGLVRQAVASNKNAIGYISLGYIDNTVKAPTLDGVVPSFENAKKGTYKVVRPFIMATKGEAEGLTAAFIEYVLSPAGQKIVANEYIPVETD